MISRDTNVEKEGIRMAGSLASPAMGEIHW
jgi:hypothetical protein